MYGKGWSNDTYSLLKGEQCTFQIDASAGVARIVFSEAAGLGILFNGYRLDDVITIPEGEVQSITVFNGNKAKPTAFEFSYSGAIKLTGLTMSVLTFSAIFIGL